MKEYRLNYCQNFKCIADKCKHTCCAGWEMNIDQKTLDLYKNHKSSFSDTLNQGINFKKSKFKADKNKRCAFLNDKNLCEIIINLGENSLCQVCADHPRFRSFFDDRIETGLGFCCEEATRIILSYNDKITPVLTFDDKVNTQLDFTQKNLLEFRKKALEVIQDRKTSINDRIQNLLKECRFDFNSNNIKKIVKTFLCFEIVDITWTKTLKGIKNTLIFRATDEKYSLIAEQFLVNSIYRHLSDAEDTLWVRARTIACVISWWLLLNIIEQNPLKADDYESIVDIVRAYSVEVEYSNKNLNKLYQFCYKFIKI